VKKNSYDRFQLLMCDLDTASSDQLDLLHAILFESEKHPSHWYQYLRFVEKNFPNRKTQFQLLIHKSVEILGDVEKKDDIDLVRVYLMLAERDRFFI